VREREREREKESANRPAGRSRRTNKFYGIWPVEEKKRERERERERETTRGQRESL